MRMITGMLLASLLAIGAGCIAGCNDVTDCPSNVAAEASCATPGLSCLAAGGLACTCTSGKWLCENGDFAVPDLSVRDMAHSGD